VAQVELSWKALGLKVALGAAASGAAAYAWKLANAIAAHSSGVAAQRPSKQRSWPAGHAGAVRSEHCATLVTHAPSAHSTGDAAGHPTCAGHEAVELLLSALKQVANPNPAQRLGASAGHSITGRQREACATHE
jgi:hypothetical protein